MGKDVTNLAIIQQGAQYYLPFKIRLNKEITSPQNVDDIIIKIGNCQKQLSKNEIEYTGEEWLFPLQHDFTVTLSGNILCQVSVKRDNNIYPSKTYTIYVDASIIKDRF